MDIPHMEARLKVNVCFFSQITSGRSRITSLNTDTELYLYNEVEKMNKIVIDVSRLLRTIGQNGV